MSSFLATGDLHITDDPRDAYRWEIFGWLRRVAAKRGVSDIVLLGDICDRKDNHPSRLVNRVVDELRAMKPLRVHVLCGNHDYAVDPTCPFFRFAGLIITPTSRMLGDLSCFFIPHVRKTEGHEWPTIPPGTKFVFCHQTFKGAVAENGTVLPGLPIELFNLPEGCEIVSGDIHVPQVLGGITYAGAPHPVRFGDSFQPRVLWFDGTQLRSLDRNTIRKDVLTIRSVEDLASIDQLREGDQVKVRVMLRRRDFSEWPKVREQVMRWAKKTGVELAGCRVEERKTKTDTSTEAEKSNARTQSPVELFRAFCTERGIDPVYVKAGEDIIRA